MHQDLFNDSVVTQYFQQKENTKYQSRNHKFYPTWCPTIFTITYAISAKIWLFKLKTEKPKQNRSDVRQTSVESKAFK